MSSFLLKKLNPIKDLEFLKVDDLRFIDEIYFCKFSRTRVNLLSTLRFQLIDGFKIIQKRTIYKTAARGQRASKIVFLFYFEISHLFRTSGLIFYQRNSRLSRSVRYTNGSESVLRLNMQKLGNRQTQDWNWTTADWCVVDWGVIHVFWIDSNAFRSLMLFNFESNNMDSLTNNWFVFQINSIDVYFID